MLIQNKAIAIVGGGPGGLTLARLLELRGAEVKVFDRDTDENARLIGSPLDMHEDSGMAALREAGLIDSLRKNYHPGADRKIIVNERAEIVFSDHAATETADFDRPHSNPEIDRAALRTILLESLQQETVVWSHQFVSMERENFGWRLHFKNGASAYADIVIAADGANSRIRPYLTNVRAFYTGITMLEVNITNAKTTTPHIYKLLNGGKVMAFGNEKCILGGQKSNGGLGFYATFKTGKNPVSDGSLNFLDNMQLLGWFKSAYPEWSDIWYEIFENADSPVIPRPIHCMPLDQHWNPLANLTMIGDAAHVMPPFAGEGANTAMGDALDLSRILTSGKYSKLEEAISFHENEMRQRASAAARISLENGERMLSAGALEKMLASVLR